MRAFSLAYLTAGGLTPPQALAIAAQCGYSHVGLRLCASVPGGAFQGLLHDQDLMRSTLAASKATGVGIYDIEVIRIREDFTIGQWLPLLEAGATLGARAVLVVGDDPDHARLSDAFARLCESAGPFGLTVNLEFLPWTALRDAHSVLQVIEAAGRPAGAGVLVDALHFARSTSTLADVAALPPDLLHYAQICDGPGSGVFSQEQMIHTATAERLLPGEGGIDLKSLFKALPPELTVSVEIPSVTRVPQLGALEWARQALLASRAVLGPVP